MCGITGWVAYGRDLRRERDTLEQMASTMMARGPDDRAVWVSRQAALGLCRLAIVDREGGRQPMAVETPGGSVTMVYSGETYNSQEIRKTLTQAGHRFTSRSDTEVVLHGYLEWGDAVADRLGGMYALAIWDGRSRKLVLIRDRMGIKPLYYFPTQDGVLFGSEPKAILANPLAPPQLDSNGLRELFAGFASLKNPGAPIWKGMAEVVPGTLVTVQSGGIRRHVYWSLTTQPHSDEQEATVARVRDLLDDIAARQVVADVPVAALLSGGLDSSVLTALAARHNGADVLQSFTVDFRGQTDNFVPTALCPTPDTPFAHEVAQHVGTRHHDVVLDSVRLADPATRAKMIQARDLPLGMGDRDASLYLLFQALKEHASVVLSGEAADELFGGYQEFFNPVVQSTPFFPWMVTLGEDFGEDGNSFTPGLFDNLGLLDFIFDCYQDAVAGVDRLDGESDFEYRMRTIGFLYLTRFVPLLLDRKDRASMACGVEVRVPFCDHRLVEYVYNTPWALKTFDGREKSLLRAATAGILPQSVRARIKSPYPFTQDVAYNQALQRNSGALLAEVSHSAFDFVSRPWLKNAVQADPAKVTLVWRRSVERALDLAQWMDLYSPSITTD